MRKDERESAGDAAYLYSSAGTSALGIILVVDPISSLSARRKTESLPEPNELLIQGCGKVQLTPIHGRFSMRSNMGTSPAYVKPVKILSETIAPPMDGVLVNLHYFEGGNYKKMTVKNMRPTYFDQVVVSSVSETLPTYSYPLAPFNSVRSLARNSFYVCKQWRASIDKSVLSANPVLDMRHFGPNNIAHLLIDIIPYYLYARDVVGPEIRVLLPPVGEPFSSLLNLFHVSSVWEDCRVTGEIIKISGTRGLAVHDLFRMFECHGINFAPDVYADVDVCSGPRFERIFLARRAPRNLGNQMEIENITNKYDYKTIFMEDYSIQEQLSIGGHAKHVIAIHGAAMSFLLMNKRVESLIEIFPSNVYDQLFPTCLGRRVIRYEQIIPEFDPRVGHSGWEAISYFKSRSFSVNAPLLDKLLSEIH
jgi:hypothetical protein